MDVFVEQLVVIKQDFKIIAFKITLILLGVLLAVGLISLSFFFPSFSFILYLLALGSVYGGYWFCGQLNNEFEYIITNNEIDIDRITNKKKRMRMANFTTSDILSIEKYDPAYHKPIKSRNINVYFGCTPDDTALAFKIKHPKHGHYYLVITPNENVKSAIKKFLPYTLKNNI